MFNTALLDALKVLQNKQILLYPTDTVWGLGCDATCDEAVSKIFQLKNREESKSLVVLVSSIEMLKTYIQEIPEKAIQIIKTSENPTTVIYNNPTRLASNTISSDNTIAIRIPTHDYCLDLINLFGKPIISTSANISGEPTPKSFSEISQPILEGVDYIVNLERDKITDKSSTILKLIGEDIEVIRA
ncbi:MAG: L-threonylcarbamoyladenylate synthase [Flavobacteriaceae bacterium]|nr:L-threonylcarbamoyladenylate synthase [Flavobacteriaceae bacterium]MDG2275792.1 L-threonylcarbamoyladenylate synthase [Flavobacteriaceae bacterium]